MIEYKKIPRYNNVIPFSCGFAIFYDCLEHITGFTLENGHMIKDFSDSIFVKELQIDGNSEMIVASTLEELNAMVSAKTAGMLGNSTSEESQGSVKTLGIDPRTNLKA